MVFCCKRSMVHCRWGYWLIYLGYTLVPTTKSPENWWRAAMRRLGQWGKYLSVGLQGVSGSGQNWVGGASGRIVGIEVCGKWGHRVWSSLAGPQPCGLWPVWCLGSLTLMSVGFWCWLAGGYDEMRGNEGGVGSVLSLDAWVLGSRLPTLRNPTLLQQFTRSWSRQCGKWKRMVVAYFFVLLGFDILAFG